MTRRITVDEAREFFAHPSQGLTGALPDAGVEYWADGPVCAAFRDFCWPRVLDVHCGVKPEAWGKTVPHARAILEAAWAFYAPDLIVAQSLETNRAVLSMNRRLGFEVIGTMQTPARVVIQGWRL
ncbi:hypothetical protein GL279_00420 [Paracoccus limosus]|uniref:N-acetyltransferase n=1 Tax=Paracoccus limosus TaxID=913252 RepID=A0A844GXB9_9RHOB|nr:hypothetical protein [Paracoccus limosus]MTH33062.1 hypothetical protein [Paracoccus limosus]